jgi:LPXTG-motif cell wall-anchored protein
MRKSLTTAALVALATGTIIVGIAGPAAATDDNSAPKCETASTTMKARPDQGFGGIWANDTFTRTVKICEKGRATLPTTAPVTDQLQIERARGFSNYEATVTDEGTFTTLADAKSPNKAVPITGIVTGKMTGGYTTTFIAGREFKHYKHALKDKTFTGDQGPKTSEWVKAMWGGWDYFEQTNMVDWKWSFWTCSDKLEKATEHWTNADPDVNEGDITGATPCPTPTPTATATPTATTPAGGTAGGGTGALPVTGSNTGILAGVAVVLLALGGGLFMAGRRRRRFTA